MSRDNLDCKIYVGDLSRDVTDVDLKSSFSYYGALKSVWIARNPPGFAFVEFEDSRDADDAVRGLDGTTIAGSRVKVEHSTGKVRPKPWARSGGGGGGGRMGGRPMRRPVNPNDKCYECGERGHYSYDCRNRRSGGGGGGAYGGSSRRGRSRSRSRSYDRDRRYSRSRSSSRNRTRSRSRD